MEKYASLKRKCTGWAAPLSGLVGSPTGGGHLSGLPLPPVVEPGRHSKDPRRQLAIDLARRGTGMDSGGPGDSPGTPHARVWRESPVTRAPTDGGVGLLEVPVARSLRYSWLWGKDPSRHQGAKRGEAWRREELAAADLTRAPHGSGHRRR